MTCLGIEGFDELADDGSWAAGELAGKGWNDISSVVVLESTTPRFADGRGSRYMRLTAANRGLYLSVSNLATVYAGCAVYMDSISARSLFSFRDAGTIQCDVRTDASGHLIVTRNGTQIGSTGTSVLLAGTWYYIEFSATINDTTGAFTVRLNGASEITGSSLDTKNTTHAYADGVYFSSSAANIFYDDLYVDDAAFAGAIRIVKCFPDGNGASSQFTGSDGNSVNNYALVNHTITENFANGDSAGYVEDANVGDIDTYSMQNLPTVPTSIYAVQSSVGAKATDAGAKSINIVTRSGGTNYLSSNRVLTSSYVYYSQIQETDPDTGSAWTESGVNGVEAGIKVAA